MQKFFTGIIIAVLTNPEVQQTIKNLLGALITERILPLVPVAVGAAVERAINLDLNGDGKPDVKQVTDAAREALDRLIPDIDLGIPALDELADFWRPR